MSESWSFTDGKMFQDREENIAENILLQPEKISLDTRIFTWNTISAITRCGLSREWLLNLTPTRETPNILFERIFQKILPARHLDLEEYLTGSPENGTPVLEKSLPWKLPAQDSKIYIYYILYHLYKIIFQ